MWRTSARGRIQFSVEKPNTVSHPMLRRTATRTIRARFSSPSVWPSCGAGRALGPPPVAVHDAGDVEGDAEVGASCRAVATTRHVGAIEAAGEGGVGECRRGRPRSRTSWSSAAPVASGRAPDRGGPVDRAGRGAGDRRRRPSGRGSPSGPTSGADDRRRRRGWPGTLVAAGGRCTVIIDPSVTGGSVRRGDAAPAAGRRRRREVGGRRAVRAGRRRARPGAGARARRPACRRRWCGSSRTGSWCS